jgi:hypothetical protein
MATLTRYLQLALLLGLAGLLPAAPAWAEGSLGLAEVLEAVRGAPQLLNEMNAERRKKDLKLSDVVCSAARHGNQWTFLGGGRAAPYECPFGDRSVKIEADRTYFDINGKKLGRLGQASDKTLFTKAKSFRESNIRWTWTP